MLGHIVSFVTLVTFAMVGAAAHADIFRWDNGELLPHSVGVEPGPGVDASFLALPYADLKGRELRGADFAYSNLSYADLSHSEMQEAIFALSNLAGASFVGGQLASADLSNAVLSGANLSDSDLSNSLLIGMLSDANFQDANLQHARIGGDLTDANLTNSDLRNSHFSQSTVLTNARLQGAQLQNADFSEVTTLSGATFDSRSVYNQWTLFPEGFDAEQHGLSFTTTSDGDFDADGHLSASDLDLLVEHSGFCFDAHARPSRFDVNSDACIDREDRDVWVHDLRGIFYGDADMNGVFDSADLVQVFIAGEYEDGIDGNSTWATGDWDGDGDFTSDDIVLSFIDGGYTTASPVPEPRLGLAACVAFMVVLRAYQGRVVRR